VKKLLSIIMTLLLLATSVCTLYGCQLTSSRTRNQVSITVIIGENELSVDTMESNLHMVLVELLDGNKISSYVYSGSTYSVYITQIDELTPTVASNEFITVFHSIDDDGLKMYGVDNVVVGDKTLYCSGVGVSMLPIVDGATYYIFIDSYSGE